MIDLKQEILNATNGGLDVLLALYPDARECVGNKNKKFKMRPEERTASAVISEKDGVWYVKDFGDSEHAMNCFDAYMKENDITSFAECLYRLADAYNVDYTLKKDINKPKNIEFKDAGEDAKDGDFDYKIKVEPSKADLECFGPFVKPATLKKYNYYALEYYTRTFINGKTGRLTTVTVTSSDDYPIFLHDIGEFKKVYIPLAYEKKDRFFYVGKVAKDYINGYDEAKKAYNKLQEETDYDDDGNEKKQKDKKLEGVFICSGERDAMNVAGMGYYPIWFNSETAHTTELQINKLRAIASVIYNIPDIDATGIREGNKLALQYMDIHTIELPQWLMTYRDRRGRPRKDLRDFLELRPTNSEFTKLKNTAKCARFWKIKYSDKGVKTDISTTSLLHYLRLNGFYKLKDRITGEMKPVRIDGYKVEEMTPKQIRDFIREDLKHRQVENVAYEAYINSKKATQSIYDDLDTIEPNFNVATAQSRTLFFENCMVEITADNVRVQKLKQGDEVSAYSWADKIIPHLFERTEPAFTFDGDTLNINYPKDADGNEQYPASMCFSYLLNASRLYWRKEFEECATDDAAFEEEYRRARRFAICSERLTEEENVNQTLALLNKIQAIGYLLRKHKEQDRARMVWLMEEKLVGADESSGGTGKSLFMTMLDYLHLCNQKLINGRRVDEKGDKFLFGNVTEQTDIVYIEDAKKSFDVTTLYPAITGKMLINPKNKDEYAIDYERSPLIVASSNFPPANIMRDGSTSRRILTVIYSDYYHEQDKDKKVYRETRQVSDDFDGKRLFGSDYTEADYNADYNFIIDCIQLYMRYNSRFYVPNLENVSKRADIMAMGDDFMDWAEEYFSEDGGNIDRLIPRAEAYQDYCDSMGKTNKTKGKKSFRDSLRAFAHFHNYELNPAGLTGIRGDGRITRKCKTGGSLEMKPCEMFYMHKEGNALNDELGSQYVGIG